MRHARGVVLLCLVGMAAALLCPDAARADRIFKLRCCRKCKARGPHESNHLLQTLRDQADRQGRLVFVLYRAETNAEDGNRGRLALMETHGRWLKGQFLVGDYVSGRCDLTYAQLAPNLAGQEGPYWFLMRPNGQVVEAGAFDTIGKDGNGSWKETVQRVATEYPPIPRSSEKGLAKLLKAAQKDFENGDYPAVDKAMLKLALVWRPAELAGPCRMLWSKFETMMYRQIGPADGMVIEEDYEGAVAAYEAILKDLGDEGKLGQEVRQKLTDLQAMMAEIVEQDQQAAEDAPPADVQHGDPATASQPDAPEASEAQTDDASTDEPEDTPPPKSDPNADQRKAASLLKLAKNYHERGMTEKAIGKLEQCVEKYPDTEAGKEARRLLARWR
jgi:hypothetical protein